MIIRQIAHAIAHPIQTYKKATAVIKSHESQRVTPLGRSIGNAVMMAVPGISAARGAAVAGAATGGVLAKAGRAVGSAYNKMTANPFAGSGNVVGALKRYGAGAAGIFATEEAVRHLYGQGAGQPVSMVPHKSEVTAALFGGLNRAVALPSFLAGYAKKTGVKASDFIKGKDMSIANPQDLIPRAPQFQNPFEGVQSPQITNIFPAIPAMPEISGGIVAGAGLGAPSVNIGGGGGGDALMMMMLLAGGAGLAGFALGKKRKKYKRGKRKKKHGSR